MIAAFVNRWPLEVTFEEARAQLGLETQRQWSDRAIERTTPALLGLFSLVVLLAHALYPTGDLPLPQAAWYPKTHATFHDVLALVRRRLWQQYIFQNMRRGLICALAARSRSNTCWLRPVISLLMYKVELRSCLKSSRKAAKSQKNAGSPAASQFG